MFLPPEDANYLQYPYNYNYNTNPITDTMRFDAKDFSSIRNPKIAQYKLWDGAYLDTPSKNQYINLVSPIEVEEKSASGWVKPALTRSQAVGNELSLASRNLAKFTAPLLEPLAIYGGLKTIVDAAKHSDDRIPVSDVPPLDFDNMTFNQKSDGAVLPLVQIEQDGSPRYTLQGGVRQDDYLLPPDIQSGSFKAFYQNLKRNPYNTLMNIQEMNNSSAGSNL